MLNIIFLRYSVHWVLEYVTVVIKNMHVEFHHSVSPHMIVDSCRFRVHAKT